MTANLSYDVMTEVRHAAAAAKTTARDATAGMNRSGGLAIYVLAVALGLSTLWDFYLPQIRIRPFDMLALTLIGVHIVRMSSALNTAVVPALTAVGVGAFGMIVDFAQAGRNLRAAFAETLVITLTAALRIDSKTTRDLAPYVRALLWIHAGALIAQFALYHFGGTFLSFHTVLGLESRNFSNTFRSSGLFLEPSSFSMNALALFAILVHTADDRPSDLAILVVSTLMSASAFGFGCAIVYAAFGISRFPQSRFKLVAAAVLSIALIAAVARTESVDAAFSATLDRFPENGDGDLDTSADARFGNLIDLVVGSTPVAMRDVVGGGFGADYLRYGSSGYAELFSIFGFPVGLALFAFVLRRVSSDRRSRWFVQLAIAIFLVNSPLLKYAFFPLRIAMLTSARRDGEDDALPPAPDVARATALTA